MTPEERAAYMREWRARHPGRSEASRQQTYAYGRALRRLRDRYRNVFDRYYAEEKGVA